MGDENLAKRADAQKAEGKRRRGKLKLQWEIALNDIERVGEEWRKRATDRRNFETADRERNERKKEDNGNGNDDQLTPDYSDAKKRTTKWYLT